MLNELLNNSSITETLTFGSTILVIGAALLLGFFISLVYIATHKKESYTSSFTISLIMLPAIISMIILLVGSNVARAFSLAGAFSLIRFRSTPGDSKDIAYVFFTLGVGLACGMGYIGYGALFAIILCMTMIVLTKCNFGKGSDHLMRLKILLPEDMDYQGIFDSILDKFTNSKQLVKIKTSEFGTLFELTYDITLKNDGQSKHLIDEVRTKNGNLNVTLQAKSITLKDSGDKVSF